MSVSSSLASSDVAFSPSVKAVQTRKGSREAYSRMEEKRGWPTTITPDLAAFLAERDSAYLATASLAGQPYVQHRGGPKGFIRVLDDKTLAFADYAGNRQYITAGNLAENDGAYLFLMDYAHRRRIKIWGRAKVVEELHFLRQDFRVELTRVRVRRLHDREDAAHRLGVRAELPGDKAESGCFEEFATIGHSIALEISTPKPGFSVG